MSEKINKYVYILTSSNDDTYYEQFLLSITSLRLYNPGAFIVALIDGKTKETLTGKRGAYENLVSEINIVQCPDRLTQKETSRWIKTSIRRLVSGNFLFIDCDTIIVDTLDISDFQKTIIGSVLDTHVPLSEHENQKEFQNRNIISGFYGPGNDLHFNSGVIYCEDIPQAYTFFDRWHDLWSTSRARGVLADQPSFNQASYELGGIITELPGEWNCQIAHNGLRYLNNAKIIHYFATSLVSFEPPYALASSSIFRSIKESGNIPPEIMELLQRPRSAFTVKSKIIADEIALDVLGSAFFTKLLWLRREHFCFFKIFNKLLSHINKPRLFKQKQK